MINFTNFALGAGVGTGIVLCFGGMPYAPNGVFLLVVSVLAAAERLRDTA